MKGPNIYKKHCQLIFWVGLFLGSVLSARHLEDRPHHEQIKNRYLSGTACESKSIRAPREKYDQHFVSREAFAKFLKQYDTVVREEDPDNFAIKWKRKIDAFRAAWRQAFSRKSPSSLCLPPSQIF